MTSQKENAMQMLKIYSFVGLILALYACHSSAAKETSPVKKDQPVELVEVDTIPEVPLEPEPLLVNYTLVSLKDTLHWLDSLPANILRNILIVNRLDRKYLAKQDSIVLPDTLVEDMNVYCPFPKKIDSIKHLHKMIYVSRYAQAFVAYENGVRVNWGPVSTGKSTTQTPAGLYSTNWKSKQNISSVNSSWVLNWYFNIHNFEGIAFHEYALPGVAASHGCVRMYGSDAEWLYGWASQWIMDKTQTVLANGTPVIIFGQYTYNQRKPWWNLAEDGQIMHFSPSQMMAETRRYLEKINNRQEVYQLENEKREFLKRQLDSLISLDSAAII